VSIELRTGPFAPWAELAARERAELAAGGFGATAAFVGTMRDFNAGDRVEAMYLEHYPGMTERALGAIVDEAIAEHDLLDAHVIHRVGRITPGEPIVLVAAWSAHRAAAFAACRGIMEALKSRAPLWKNEQTERGSRWVESNTPG